MSSQGFEVRLTARTDQYIAAMKGAQASTEAVAKSGTNFDQLGGKMQDVGVSLSKSVTLPLIAVGGAAVKMSSDFEGAFGRMVGLAGVSADEVDGLKKAVLGLSGETGQAPQDLADGLYFLRSSGLDSAKAMDALKQSALASSAGLGSTAVIADAVSSAMNAYAKSGLSAAEATDILVGTARAGKAEPAELAGALGRVLPVASELGITFKDVGGAIAALSLTGNDASTSATLLSNIMSKMLKPSQQGAEALAAVGMSADSIRTSIADKGLLATLEELHTRLGDAGFVKFLEDQQAVNGALTLVGQNAEHVGVVFDQVAGSAGATQEAFNAMADTSGFKMRQAWADVQVALIKAGDVIMPIVSNVAGAIGHLAEIFSGLPGPVQTIVVAFLGLAAAAGPMLIIGGTLVKNFKEIKSVLTGVGPAASGLVGPLAILGVAAIGLGMRATHAADEIRAIGKAADELARVSDAEVLGVLGKATAEGVIAGQNLNETYKILAQTNIEGAKRALELAEAKGMDVKITDALRAAINNEMAATAQAAATTEQYSAARDSAAVAQDHFAEASLAGAGAVDGLASSTDGLTQSTAQADAATAALQRRNEELAAAVQRGLDEMQRGWDELTGTVSDDQSWTNLQLDFGQLKTKFEEANKAMIDGTDEAATKALEYRAQLDGQKLSVIQYGKEVLGLPKERLTRILAALDAGDLALAEAQLANLTRNRNISLDIQLKGGSGNFSIVPGTRSAAGRFAPGGSNIYSSLGEVAGPAGDEVVLPVGNAAALKGWMSDPRVGPPVAAAMGGGWSGPTVAQPASNSNSVNFYGGIHTDIDMKAAWQQANFALISAAA